MHSIHFIYHGRKMSTGKKEGLGGKSVCGGGGGGCLICFRHRGKSGSRRKEGSVLFNDS